MSIPAPIHRVTVCPAACLPGMVLINFLEPQPDIVTSGGNPARLAQTGCAEDELPVFLTELEGQHGITVIVTAERVASEPELA